MERRKQKIAIVVLLLLVAMLLRVAAQQTGAGAAAPLLRSAIHIGLLIAWGICLHSRVMQPQALGLLLTAAGLMLFWFVIRLLKYEFVEEPTLTRYLWYLYYLPMLFIPLCALLTAMLLGKGETAHLPRRVEILIGISAALFLLVMTNDFHQLVFRFPQAKPWGDRDYGYGPGYYAVAGWLLLCGLGFLVLLLYKCRIPKSRKFIWLPCVPVVVLLGYTVLYLLRVKWLFTLFGDLPATFCLCYGAILESCMDSGLIQTNTGYDLLFEAATICAQITDEAWNTCYHSGASCLEGPVLAKAEYAPVLLNRTTLLKTSPIRGGHVAWQEDVTELAAALERLEENQRELEDETYLEQEALRARQEVLYLREKNKLYDLIERFTAPQTAMLDALLQEFQQTEDPALGRRLLAKSCVLGAYIKRCGNLLLIREGSTAAPAAELQKAIEESMQNLALNSTECSLRCTIASEVSTAAMVQAYAFFQQVVFASVDSLETLFCTLRMEGKDLLLRMELETGADLSPLASAAGVHFRDGVWMISTCFSPGGEP